jgi:hypothetical protein
MAALNECGVSVWDNEKALESHIGEYWDCIQCHCIILFTVVKITKNSWPSQCRDNRA